MAIQSTVRIYAVTLTVLAEALLLRWLLDPWLGDHLALTTLYAAVALAVWVGGLRPAILAVVLGYLVSDWLFIAPRGQFNFTPPRNFIGLILYLLSCAIIIFLGNAVREARRRAEASLAQVEEEIIQRKQAEQTLLASQRRLRLVSDHMPALISYVDREGYYRFNNTRYEEWFGIQAEQIVGRQMRDLLGETIYEQRLPFIERALAGEVVSFEGPTQHQQLGVRDTQLTYVPNTDEHGTVQGVYVMAQDVTERKQTEDRYHGLFTAMQEGFLLSELIEDGSEQRIDFRYLDVNPAAERMLGLKREQIVGQSARAIIPVVRKELLQQYAQVARTGEPLRHEVFEPMLKQYHENFAFCPAPGQVAILFWDITERKLAEEALRESEERFRLATNAGSVGVWDWDIVSNRISWSDSLYAIHGLKPDEFAGTVEAFAELIHPDDRAFVNEAIQRTLQEGVPYELEFRAMRPDGTLIWISTQAQVMRDAAGLPQRLLGGTVDVTRRKQAELALRESEEQQAFLLKLSDQLRTLANPADIQYEAARILGEHLGADRVGYAEDQGDGETLVVMRNYTTGVPSIEGRHRYADYGATLLTECQAGRTVVQPNIANDPALTDAEKAAHTALQIGASVNVPLVKAGRLAALLFVHCHAAHAWSPNEVTLMQETAERLWAAVERARAEAAVRASETRFRQVFDEAPVGMVQAELNGRLQQVNPAICALFGRPAEELIGIHPDELTPPEYRAGDQEYFRQVRQGVSQASREKEYLRRDGSRIWGQLTATLVHDAAGKPSYYIVIIEDITVRKQVAETLRASEERYRNLLTSIDQGFCVFEMIYDAAGQAVDYRFLEVNPTFERHTGLKDAVGKTAKELVPHLEAHWIEAYGQVAATGEARRFEQGSLEMGRLFDVEAARVGGNQSRKVGLLLRDITETRRAEERLRESEARFRNMADHAPVMIWVTEADWSCTYLSQSWYEFTGQTPEIGLGFGWLQAVHPDDQQVAHDAFVSANANETDLRVEYRLQRQDGTYAWVLDSARPRLSASGEFLGYIGSVTDISERKQIEQEREELLQRERYAREQAEAATHAKDEFIAVVSHELRTPLNAILGYNRMLQKPELLTAAEHAKFTAIVDQSARRQLKLIEDLLDTARFISGKLRLEMQPCNFLWLVKMAVEEARPTAEAKQVMLVTELDETLPPLLGDPERLQQIVWNLLSNALKFTPAGGAVIIRLTQHAVQVQLTVTDTGQGIAPHVLPFIFDRFRQADSSSSRRHGGLGLGLALVKQLTELHGGNITAASAGVGQGSTFTLCLPLHSATTNNKRLNTPTTMSEALEPDGPTIPSFSTGSQLAGVRVLVVDDEPEARELVGLLLQAQGARVTPLASGAAALALLTNTAQASPDVLISDVGMPEMDGYELLQQVRAQGLRIPAIALTAFGRAEDRLRALTAGFQMHVPKPVEPEELITVLASLTGRLGKDPDV